MPKPHDPKPRRFWVELDKPTSAHDAASNCEMGNAVLRKLFGPDTPFEFFPGSRTAYNLRTSSAGTYLELADRGHWFYLDAESVAAWAENNATA